MEVNYISEIYIMVLYLCVFLLLRSMFFLVTARKLIPRFNLYFFSTSILSGVFYMTYNYQTIIESPFFVALSVFLVGCSLAFYFLTKIDRDIVYMLSGTVKEAYTKAEAKISNRFNKENKLEDIGFGMLKELDMNVVYEVDNLFIVKYVTAYIGLFFKTVFPPGASMSRHHHSGCIEYCYVIEGQMVDWETGKVYNEGDLAKYKAGEIHWPKNKSLTKKLVVHVYFEEVDNTNISN